ncbi:MAG: glycosyltransferase [Gemmatimonadetes bacterium]|nr:glycosyltransferase [Gemmatimonadota bacterium]
MPTFRRPAALARCLEALACQTLPPERFEVVVADDGSGAPPHDVVARFKARISVRLVEAPHGGPGAARNVAATRANGRFLALTDDDCAPEPTWLASLERTLTSHPEALVGGRVENALVENAMASASQLLIGYLYEYFARVRSPQRFFTTNNVACSARAFEEVGGFDVESLADTAEDRDLCDRWSRSGRPLVYDADALVHHHNPFTLAAFLRCHFNYGQGAVHFHRARARRDGSRVRLEPFGFYTGMLAYPFRHERPARAPICAVLVALSQLSYAAGYLIEPTAASPAVSRRASRL